MRRVSLIVCLMLASAALGACDDALDNPAEAAVSMSLGKGDIVLYSVSGNQPITPVLWDFEQSVVNGATVASVPSASARRDDRARRPANTP